MKPALCFNSKKLQNIYKLDAITTADSTTILNNKKRPQILSKTAINVRVAENRQAFKTCGKMTVFRSSLLNKDLKKPEDEMKTSNIRPAAKTRIEDVLEDH